MGAHGRGSTAARGRARGARGPDRPARGSTAGGAASLFRRPYTFRDRRGAGHAARHGQGPHAVGDGEAAHAARRGHMNDQDHSHHEDNLAAYLLDALPGDEAREFERHLDGCARCQERARWLQGSIDLLPAAVEQYEPPPALRKRLMETVRAEAEPAAVPRRRRSWRDLFAISRPALAMAAVLLVAVAVGAYALGL